MAVNKVLIKDIGIEIELPHISEIDLRSFVQYCPPGWRSEHDGSTQRQMFKVKSILPVKSFHKVPDYLYNYIAPETSGGELVSPIIKTDRNDNWKNDVKDILRRAEDEYYGFLDPKCSIHFHVNMTGAPVYVLHNIVNIWKALEAVMYRISIAELGYHRGVVNKNYLYCRPLVSPQVVLDKKCLRPSFSPDKLLLSRNLPEFFMALGNTPTEIDPDKYNPVRYGGLNFFNFIRFGTVEVRTFNLTYNPKNVLAWAELSQAICQAAFGKPFDGYPDLLLGYSGDFQMEILQVMLNLSDETMITLYELFHMNDWVEFNSPSWQFTHVPNNRANWDGVDRKFIPNSIEGETVRVYLDKHSDEFYEITKAEDYGNPPRLANPKPRKFKPLWDYPDKVLEYVDRAPEEQEVDEDV